MKQELVKAAQEALQQAYAPYSGYRVGAAVLAGQDVFKGVNIENASYGLTICAERSAVAAAISSGARQIQGVAIAV
ncbi:MAG: cytidine deaminase, partial [Peptococcaceae bacterium]|nr:cytidine deaminase [Peptococcaceae bacterium]